MNKTELVAAMAEQTNLSKKDAGAALKAFIDVVTDELKKGEKSGFVKDFDRKNFLNGLHKKYAAVK